MSPIAWFLYFQQQVLNSEPGDDLQPVADLLEEFANPIAEWDTLPRPGGGLRFRNLNGAKLKFGRGAVNAFPWQGSIANYIRNGGRQHPPRVRFMNMMHDALLAVMNRGIVPVALCDMNGRIVGNAATQLANQNAPPPSTLVKWGPEQDKYDKILGCVKRAARDIVGFRGIGANVTVQTVLRQWRGLSCWADTPQGRERHNMDNRFWNPWSHEWHRRYMYFRPRANDNCLLTCSSFCPSTLEADAFKVTTCFPKISGFSAQKKRDLLKPVKFMETARIGGVNVRQERTRNCLVDVSRSFLVCIRKGEMYFDTNAAQNVIAPDSGYPEMALRKIPATNILGCVTYVRVFHGEDEDSGYTAIPVTGASGLFEGPAEAEGANDLLQRALTSFSAKWVASGFEQSSPRGKPGWSNGDITITHVDGSEVLNGQLPAYADAMLGARVLRTMQGKLRIPDA
ncbi:hypothetical protein ACN28S_40705 [Cystobacter fuscus]